MFRSRIRSSSGPAEKELRAAAYAGVGRKSSRKTELCASGEMIRDRFSTLGRATRSGCLLPRSPGRVYREFPHPIASRSREYRAIRDLFLLRSSATSAKCDLGLPILDLFPGTLDSLRGILDFLVNRRELKRHTLDPILDFGCWEKRSGGSEAGGSRELKRFARPIPGGRSLPRRILDLDFIGWRHRAYALSSIPRKGVDY